MKKRAFIHMGALFANEIESAMEHYVIKFGFRVHSHLVDGMPTLIRRVDA